MRAYRSLVGERQEHTQLTLTLQWTWRTWKLHNRQSTLLLWSRCANHRTTALTGVLQAASHSPGVYQDWRLQHWWLTERGSRVQLSLKPGAFLSAGPLASSHRPKTCIWGGAAEFGTLNSTLGVNGHLVCTSTLWRAGDLPQGET